MTAPLNPAGLFIDLDGTLADSLAVMRMAYEGFLGQFGVAGAHSEFALLNGPPLSEVIRRLRATHNLPGELEALTDNYYRLIDELYRSVAPAPGARELLERAQRFSCKVAVVTSNSAGRTEAWLAAVGLAPLIDFIISGDDVTRGKPDPEPYLMAAARAGLDGQICAAVEDTIQGAQAAMGAGLSTFLLMSSHGSTVPVPGVAPVNSLYDVASQLWPAATSPGASCIS